MTGLNPQPNNSTSWLQPQNQCFRDHLSKSSEQVNNLLSNSTPQPTKPNQGWFNFTLHAALRLSLQTTQKSQTPNSLIYVHFMNKKVFTKEKKTCLVSSNKRFTNHLGWIEAGISGKPGMHSEPQTHCTEDCFCPVLACPLIWPHLQRSKSQIIFSASYF